MPKKSSPLSQLKEIYGFMVDNSLETLELDEAGLRVKLVRRKAPAPAQVPVVVAAASGAAAPTLAANPGSPAAESSQTLPPNCTTIKSSMMGIFYRAPTPSSPPFVKEGDQIKPGAVLCMVEAMKVFNEIKAEFACTIVKALLENGKPVKSGQDLFIVQRS